MPDIADRLVGVLGQGGDSRRTMHLEHVEQPAPQRMRHRRQHC